MSIVISSSSLPASLPTRGGWIEIDSDTVSATAKAKSLPTRGGWIEIGPVIMNIIGHLVPPHTGRVD